MELSDQEKLDLAAHKISEIKNRENLIHQLTCEILKIKQEIQELIKV